MLQRDPTKLTVITFIIEEDMWFLFLFCLYNLRIADQLFGWLVFLVYVFLHNEKGDLDLIVTTCLNKGLRNLIHGS